MKNVKPLFNPATHYRIEVQGRVDVDWLQSFNSSAEISMDETSHMDDISVLDTHTDQSGIVGLVRSLHRLGMTILKIQIVSDGGKASESQ